MAQVFVQSVGVYQGPCYETPTEDGPMVVFDSFAGVTDQDGREWHHLVPFRSPHADRLQELVIKIRAKGVINTDHWVELERRPSLEERLAMIAQREDQVRHGLLAEEDLYHGVP